MPPKPNKAVRKFLEKTFSEQKVMGSVGQALSLFVQTLFGDRGFILKDALSLSQEVISYDTPLHELCSDARFISNLFMNCVPIC